MEVTLVSSAIKFNKDWVRISKERFPDIMPSILMTKYDEIVNRKDDIKLGNPVSDRQIATIKLEDENDVKITDSNKGITILSDSQSLSEDEGMQSKVVRRKNSATEWTEIIKVQDNPDDEIT